MWFIVQHVYVCMCVKNKTTKFVCYYVTVPGLVVVKNILKHVGMYYLHLMFSNFVNTRTYIGIYGRMYDAGFYWTFL